MIVAWICPRPSPGWSTSGGRLVADGLPLAGGALTLAAPHPIIARRTWLWRAETGAVIEALGFAGGTLSQARRSRNNSSKRGEASPGQRPRAGDSSTTEPAAARHQRPLPVANLVPVTDSVSSSRRFSVQRGASCRPSRTIRCAWDLVTALGSRRFCQLAGLFLHRNCRTAAAYSSSLVSCGSRAARNLWRELSA